MIAWFLAVGTAAVAGCSQQPIIPPPGGDTLFRDDFDGTLGTEWSIDSEDPLDVSLTARPGFARLLPPQSFPEGEQTAWTVILRDLQGDFVLIARVEFETTADLQSSGLVIRGEDGRTVALGLFSAAGARGSLRGIGLRADRGPDVVPGRAIAQSDLENVYLRLERSADRYTGSFSGDGTTYTVVGTLTNDLSDRVSVGIGTAADTRCTQNCDQRVPADFDFFEIIDASPAG